MQALHRRVAPKNRTLAILGAATGLIAASACSSRDHAATNGAGGAAGVDATPSGGMVPTGGTPASGGTPLPCAASLVRCVEAGPCVDLLTSPDHCGTCENICPSRSCIAGVCSDAGTGGTPEGGTGGVTNTGATGGLGGVDLPTGGLGGNGANGPTGGLGGFGAAGATAGAGGLGTGGGLAETGGAGGDGTAGLGGAFATGGVPATGGARPTVTAAPGTELVKVDATVRYQTFEGWGTSLCWWANHVGGWSEANRNAVVEAVVDPVGGLGYNIFRYNIGGGENPAHDHMQQYRDMPGFQQADGTWNFDADANQRSILLRIAERGTDVIFEAFSNSPPYWMTESGCASGSNDGSNNLRDDSYDAFADYLTEVVRYYRDQHGIAFRTLEPLNEPYATWWTANGSQEGCHFDPSSQERIIQAVDQQLAAKGLVGTVVSASDENSMDDALSNVGSFSDVTLAALGQFNVHSYAGSRRSELRALATTLGLRLWQSESGPLGQSISDDTEAALFMAGRIIEDLRELQPEAWVDWQTGDPSRSWASLTLNDAQQTYAPLKRFYMHAGFSRYIRPGAIFVDVDHSDMVAALGADDESLTIVVRNPDVDASRAFTFDLTTLPTVGSTTTAWRTTQTEDLAELPPSAIENYALVVTVPPYSVTTFVVPIPASG